LWVYSLADSSSAAAEVAQLESRGFQATYRAVQLAERGRWYRVYVGSFASRADAEAAVPYVKGELKDDWVQPARF
jgi:cell division protein FtsN